MGEGNKAFAALYMQDRYFALSGAWVDTEGWVQVMADRTTLINMIRVIVDTHFNSDVVRERGPLCEKIAAYIETVLEAKLAEARAIISRISTHPDVAAYAGVGDGTVADAVTALVGRATVAERERDAWIETAAQHCRNEEYYRGLVVQIGRLFGVAAMTSDDGSVQDHVLCAKVPELVGALQATLAPAREAFLFISQGHTIPGYKGESENPLIALAQEVIHGAQVTARKALAALDAGKKAPCGHPASAIVTGDEGTGHCAECEQEAGG